MAVGNNEGDLSLFLLFFRQISPTTKIPKHVKYRNTIR